MFLKAREASTRGSGVVLCLCEEHIGLLMLYDIFMENESVLPRGLSITVRHDVCACLVGLVAMKELIFNKPSTRSVCVPSVLSFTYHSDSSIRTKAVRLAANLMWAEPAFQSTVEAFAKQVIVIHCVVTSMSPRSHVAPQHFADVAVVDQDCHQFYSEQSLQTFLRFGALFRSDAPGGAQLWCPEIQRLCYTILRFVLSWMVRRFLYVITSFLRHFVLPQVPGSIM